MKKTQRDARGLEKRLAVLRTTVRELQAKELSEVHGGMAAAAMRAECCPCYSSLFTER